MSLRLKTLFITSITLLILLGVLFAILAGTILNGFSYVENQDMRQDVSRVQAALAEDINTLNLSATGWSDWDETYDFMEDHNSNYLKTNITNTTFTHLNINVFAMLDTAGTLQYGKGFDLKAIEITPLPDTFVTLLNQKETLLQRHEGQTPISGTMQLGNNNLIVVARPILGFESKGPAHGTLLMGRYMDADYIQQLASRTKTTINIYNYADSNLPSDVVAFQQSLPANPTPSNSIFVQPLDAKTMAGYSLINDIAGKPLLVLRMTVQRPIYEQGQRSLRNMLIVLVIVGLASGVLTLTILDRLVLARLSHLTASVAKIGSEGEPNLAIRVPEKGKDELADLGKTINNVLQAAHESQQAVLVLNERLKNENLRMSAELEVTRQLQQMILPEASDLDKVIGLEIASYMKAADEVGGDYYDVLPQVNGGVKIGIGDVTGHGLASGVVMLMVQTALHTLSTYGVTDPIKLLQMLNRTIYANVQHMHLDKNLSFLLLDYQGDRLQLSGQHESMVIVRGIDGNVEVIDTMDLGFPIGLEEDIDAFVAQTEICLTGGDVIVLYTDGVTEAENMEGLQYGLEHLCEVVQTSRKLSAMQIKQAIIDDLTNFIGCQKVFDDITLLVLKQRDMPVTHYERTTTVTQV
jgi:sigma-B regulation protein RsbU (phosphoserine phosphatase)